MERHRCVIQTIGQRIQLPNPTVIPRAPFGRGLDKNNTSKSISLKERILNVDAPKFPIAKCRQRYNLKMGRAKAHTPRRLNETILQVRVLVAFCHQSSLNGFSSAHHLAGENPSGSHYGLIASLWFTGRKRPKMRPCI